jgi:nitroreductase/NAD-dependent dihydropyrimidine dehydrogenase PreA subunit
MSWIKIDEDKCTKCGLCAADCPRGDLLFSPEIVPNSAEKMWCIHCGHCAAICPTGALDLDGIPPERLNDTDGAPLPRFSSVAQLMSTRRSIRAFTSRPLGREALGELLEAANYAPTGANGRTVRWTVVDTPEELKKVASMVIDWMRASQPSVAGTPYETIFKTLVDNWDDGVDCILWDAPVLAVAHASKHMITPQQDCVIAITYLELAAWANGVGSCWGGFLNRCASMHKPLRDALGLDEDEGVYGSLMLGYPSRTYAKVPHRAPSPVIWK